MSVRAARLVLTVLAASAAYVGVWALLAPRSFFASFPGGGRSWVAADGPFNEHLVRDVGALYLALLVVTLAAAVRPESGRVRLTGVAWLVFGVPHLAYHAAHLGLYEGGVDDVLHLVALGGTVALAAALCLPMRRRARGAAVTTGSAASSSR